MFFYIDMAKGGAMPGAGRPKTETPKKPVTIRITDADRKFAETEAKKEGKSLSSWILGKIFQ